MLLSKLAKASHQGSSTNPPSGKLSYSGSKRATLEVFSQLRESDEYNELYRTTEEEIGALLDKNLFREIGETSDESLRWPFGKVSNVSAIPTAISLIFMTELRLQYGKQWQRW